MAKEATSPIFGLAQLLHDTQYIKEKGVEEDVMFLQSTCPMIEAVLHDAEDREIHDKSVKLWLRCLKDLAADAEDLLEEYEYHVHQAKIEGETSTKSSKISRHDEIEGGHMITGSITLDKKERHAHLTFSGELSKRLGTIRKRFDVINEQRQALCLRPKYGDRRPQTQLRPLVGHLADEAIMCGRDDDKKALGDLLKYNNLLEIIMPNQKRQFVGVVIGLVGIGGVGKTTLAQALYEDVEINQYFDCKAWVTVSDAFDILRVTKDILVSLTGIDCTFTQLSVIQDKLTKQLQGKKFFLVLDDVWEEKWSSMGFLLQMGSIGSKILVTSRIERVAKIMRPSIAFDLGPLSDDDGWELFRRHAFGGNDQPVANLVKMCREIARKCRGLPLLLKVLGDLLRDAGVHEKRWREILNNDTWEIKDENGNNDILETLKLSYFHLPMRLKQCFLHCSVFPKDYQFRKHELARLWAAYELIKAEGSKQVEDIGEECVDGLLGRSFLQPHSYVYAWYTRRQEMTFSLHDVMHDLAQYILHGEHSLIQNRANKFDLHRPLLQHDSQFATSQTGCCYEPIPGRTFHQSWYPSKEVRIDILFENLKRLRVLLLEDQFLASIPDSIGDLKHLRYLCLRTRLLRRLPDSVCTLYNLQTLECRYIQELPKDIRKLKKLQHIFVSLSKIPVGIGELVELHTLKRFRVTGEDEYGCLSELENLAYLSGELTISGLNNVSAAEEARLSRLSDKVYLKHLVLEWDPEDEEDVCEQSILVLNNLKPHVNLEELHLIFYVGASFPKWLGSTSFTMLTKVNLFYCFRCEALPPLGQLPSLKYLNIKDLHNLKRVGPEFYGRSPSDAFPSLQYLNLTHMDSMEEWWGMDECRFPQLSTLLITFCPSLRFTISYTDAAPHLPHMFHSVHKINVEASPHVADWCIIHACTTLAKVKNLTVNEDIFYFPRRGDQTYTWSVDTAGIYV